MERSNTEEQAKELSIREAMLPGKVREWRAKLSTKAKQEKRYRFYSLYGQISHPETLQAAWQQVRAKAGAPGVDGISIGRRNVSRKDIDWRPDRRNFVRRCSHQGSPA